MYKHHLPKMEYHNDKEGAVYARVRFRRQKAVNIKYYNGYWYYHFDDPYGTKITLGEDEFGDFTYIINNDLPKIKEEIQKKVNFFLSSFIVSHNMIAVQMKTSKLQLFCFVLGFFFFLFFPITRTLYMKTTKLQGRKVRVYLYLYLQS